MKVVGDLRQGYSRLIAFFNKIKNKTDMEEYEIEASDLLARAICHEIDHLDGILYVTRAEGDLRDVVVSYEEDEEEEE